MGFELTVLGEFAKVQGGFAYKSKDFQSTSNCPVLKIKNVRFGHIEYENTSFIGLALAEETDSWSTKEGDILISMTGSGPNAPQSLVGRVGRVWRDDPKAWINQRVGRIQVESKTLHPDFVFYLLSQKESQEFLVSNSSGSANQANISGKTIELLPCPRLEFQESRDIANILRPLDEKIILNRQTNQALEQMAQALFKSWFVDFDPVIDKALAAGNPIPDELQDSAKRRQNQLAKSDHKPLPDNILQLFPSEFELTEELGWVPLGWSLRRIGEVANVVKGASYKSSELADSGVALVTLKSFNRGGGYRLDGLKEYTGRYKPEQEVFAGDLIIAYTDVTQAADVIGKPAMVISDSRYDHLVVSLDVSVVRPNEDSLKYFLYGLAQTSNFQSHTYSHSTGTTVLHLGKKAVPEYPFAMPNVGVIEAYVSNVAPGYRAIDLNVDGSRSLSKLRDTLLPKLISGELRLPPKGLCGEGQKLS
jgi:type I restriction enzyme S subunit